MFSLLMLVMGVAPILAPLAGGYLATGLGWRAIFMLLAAIGIAAAILVHLRLDETLDPSRATATIRPGAILRNYVIVLRDRHFLRYTLSNSCALAGMFAYISGSPFVLIDLYGVSPEHYGLYFGANAFGLIGLSQFNRRLLRRFSFEAILPAAFGAMMACGLFVMIAGTLHLPLAWFAAGLFLFVSGIGLVGPNSAAGAMSDHPERAGSAAALYGTLQFSVAAAASGLVSAFHDGTARPMTWIIGLSAVIAFAIFMLLKPRTVAAGATLDPVAGGHALEHSDR
jgi:DHA1 family bicyclomycin/chloramphenicol resistance-like MFS transporter